MRTPPPSPGGAHPPLPRVHSLPAAPPVFVGTSWRGVQTAPQGPLDSCSGHSACGEAYGPGGPEVAPGVVSAPGHSSCVTIVPLPNEQRVPMTEMQKRKSKNGSRTIAVMETIPGTSGGVPWRVIPCRGPKQAFHTTGLCTG